MTNGDIKIVEKTDDLQVGTIESTCDDVFLYAPKAIVDQVARHRARGRQSTRSRT